jgi:hypothetical protein
MIDALIAGKLYGVPNRRTSKNGNAFTVAKVRTDRGGIGFLQCDCIC